MLRTHDEPSNPGRSDPERSDPARWADDTPVAAVDETLVAYLDGELDESERHLLEDRLLSDAGLRQRLSELQSGWEMLDYLPRPSVPHDFARSTVEMVAASASQMLEIQRQHRPRRKLGWFVVIAIVTLLMAWAGVALFQRLERMRFEAQLADLPLAEHLDAYQLDVDLELMQQLAEDPNWNEAMQLASEAGGLVVPQDFGLAERSLAERAQLIPHLEPAAQRRLTGQWERLQLLEPEQLAQVRQNAEAVRQLEQPAAVLRTMEEYARWFESLPPEKQERIVNADDPRGVILEEVELSELGWVRDYGLALGESDREFIYEGLKLIARDRLEWADSHGAWSDDRLRFLKNLRDRRRQERPSDGISFSAEEFLLGGMAWSSLRPAGREQREPADQESPAGDDAVAVLFGPPTAEEMDAIEEVISNRALLILNATAGASADRDETLWRWCIAIIRSKSPTSDNPEVVLNRYLAMDPDDRELLDLKTPEEIFDELTDRRRSGPRGSRP